MKKSDNPTIVSNNILAELFKVKFPNADADALTTVVNATPNPSIATEMLCGIFQMPEIAGMPSSEFHREYGYDKHNVEFVDYNVWEDVVHFRYNPQPHLYVWVPKGSDTTALEYADVKKNEKDYLVDSWFSDAVRRMQRNKKYDDEWLDSQKEDNYERVKLLGDVDTETWRKATVSSTTWNGENNLAH